MKNRRAISIAFWVFYIIIVSLVLIWLFFGTDNAWFGKLFKLTIAYAILMPGAFGVDGAIDWLDRKIGRD